eukprot:CAMPEP_0176356838 /NCGR_PEP_ID=MMETSP0126-20121128/14309_1 /TAXON_ID=141414 ORGANISM="Strombidinopsis acuminatum, Strain SPMC142" /NCGR_SAMPLE_ID=MMETSP0126 /ASSEMBLY_ACC=CAM_ASM_000229 /LENGTH=39 /DNA_ID= /DNA_START= /DNA_END= /DNA_ORIENTATION=
MTFLREQGAIKVDVIKNNFDIEDEFEYSWNYTEVSKDGF